MKFLRYRQDFLHSESELDNQIESSTLIKEYFENDIKFGDSYFGRLINSTISMVRTGYKHARIPFLLKDLEVNLTNMVDRIKFEQIANEYPRLYLKAILEEIKVFANGTATEEEKLKVLIGWDGTSETMDPTNPTKDIPGFYVGRRLVDPDAILQSSHDKISEPAMRKRLEKSLNPSIVKEFLDSISRFIDKLREYAHTINHPSSSTPSPTVTSPTPFNLNLVSVLTKIVNMNLTESFRNFRFPSYVQFINEEVESEKNLKNLEELQKVASQLMTEVEDQPEEKIKNSQVYQTFVTLVKNLNDDEKQIIRKNELEQEINNLVGLSTQVAKTQTSITPTQPQSKRTGPPPTVKPTIQTVEPVKEDEPSVKTDDESATDVENKTPQNITEKPEDEVTPEENEDEDGSEGINPKQLTAESNSYFKYISRVLETVGTPPPPTGSSTTPSTPSTPSTGSTSTVSTSPSVSLSSVEDIWKAIYKELDKVFPAEMTQDDLNKLNSFTPSDVNMADSIVKQPNPLIKIGRIFEKANAVYTTPIIPSGRENGEVWPVTFRRYVHASGSTSGTAKSPGSGPWVHKPLFSQWKSGVYSILSKPEFSDLFPDIASLKENHISNKSLRKINEQSVSSVKILQEFFLEALNIKNQASFDDFLAKLIRKIFGIDISPNSLRTEKGEDVNQSKVDGKDIEPNIFKWEPFKSTRFENSNIGQLFAFPIVDNRRSKGGVNHNIIFLRVMKIDGNKVEVKFTYDEQGEAELLIGKKPGAKKDNWNKTSRTTFRNIYYGVMKNDFSSGIQICYANIADSNKSSYKAKAIYGEPMSTGKNVFGFNRSPIRILGGEKALFNARLVYFDDTKKKRDVKELGGLYLFNELKIDEIKRKGVEGSSKTIQEEILDKGKTWYGWT